MRDLCFSFESYIPVISIEWAKILIELKNFANKRFNLFKETSLILIWIDKHLNCMAKNSPQISKIPLFWWFLLNKKLVIQEIVH